MFNWLLSLFITPKCENCNSKEWKRALWKEDERRPLYCDACPGKDGENFRGLDGTMNKMDERTKHSKLEEKS